MRKFLILLIRVYRYSISPFLGNNCRYTPTCSEYAIESIQRFGIVKGSYLATKRVISCHPWGKSGYDPVPHDHS